MCFSPFWLYRLACPYNVGVAIILVLPTSALFGQTSAPAGIFSDSVYSNIVITTDVVYGWNTNYFTNNSVDTLKMDIYEPDSVIDYLRPVIIYLHAGGFVTGDKGDSRAVRLGNHFARCGYLFASINYRLGVDNVLDTIDNFQMVYQITQDAKSAVRYFRKHQLAYCVDTQAIFLMGSSAGASICLTVAYWDQIEADTTFDTSIFGPLDAASGNIGYSSQVTGIVPCWGGMPDTTWLRGETEPAYLFHGTNDQVVPYTFGYANNGVYLHGSYNIHQQLVANGVESYLYPLAGAGHGVPVYSKKYDSVINLSTAFIYDHLPPDAGSKPCGYSVDDEVNAELSSFPITLSSTIWPEGMPVTLHNRSRQSHCLELRIVTLQGQLWAQYQTELRGGEVLELGQDLRPRGMVFMHVYTSAGKKAFPIVAVP